MFQCPGCLSFINIVQNKSKRPPVAYELDGVNKHSCKELRKLKRELKKAPPIDQELEVEETNELEIIQRIAHPEKNLDEWS